MPPGSHILTTTGTAKYPALVGQPGLCQMSQNLSCKIQVVNSSHVAVRIPRGTVCGTYELIDDDTLHKIRPISPQYVQQIAEVEERKRPAPPTVRTRRQGFHRRPSCPQCTPGMERKISEPIVRVSRRL